MTVRLNSRCLHVLSLLVTSDGPIAAADIGNQLQISARMVRSSLAPAGAWLQDKNVTLQQTPGRGIYLDGPAGSKRRLAEAIRAYDHPLLCLSPVERLQIALHILCFAEGPIQVKQLQQALSISRATAFLVLGEAEAWLYAHRLQLVRKPNYGCMVLGDERNWRAAAIDLIQESAGHARLLALLQGAKTVVDVASRPRAGLEEALSTAWAKLDIQLIQQLMSPLVHEFAGRLSDQAYIEVCIYLAVSLYRIRAGKTLELRLDPSRLDRLASRIPEAKQIAARLHQRSGILLSAVEIDWLALKIAEAGAQPSTSKPSLWRPAPGLDPAVLKMVNRIVAQASVSLHPSLGTDRELVYNLATQLERYVDPHSAPRGQSLAAPLLHEVKLQFPYVYSVARQSSMFLTEQLGIQLDENEIGNIATCLIAAMERLRQSSQPKKRVLVVCGEGAVTAWLLVSRLRAEFPDVEVAEVISALDLETRRDLDGIDVIVSTIPLKIKNIPHRQVNPLLRLDDCRKLKELLQQKGGAPANDYLGSGMALLSDLLTAQTIDLAVEAADWRDAVRKSARRLLQAGAVEQRFVRSLEEIILEYGPYMVIWPGAVLLHAPPDGVRQMGMELMTLKTPVFFGHPDNDPVRIAIVLAARDNRLHLTALQQLNRLMQDEEARSAIATTTHRAVALHWIAQYSNSSEM